MINDVYHYWGSDLSSASNGDLLTSNSTTRGQQRILRRLLTNPGDYVFQPDYGAGLPSFVGQPLDPGKVAALIRAQILLEDSVAQDPAPQISVQVSPIDPTAIAVTIAYNDAASGKPVVLSFNVSN